MLSLKRLFVISRPVFYLTSLSIYLGGFTYSDASFSWIVLAGAVFMTFFMGLIAYGINDIADRKSDALNPRKGKLDGAVLKDQEVKPLLCVIVGSGLAWIITFAATQRFGSLAAVIAIYILALSYSVRPLRLKTRPPFDALTNGAWAICMFLVGYWIGGPSDTLSWPPTFLLIAIGLAMTGVHTLAAIADYDIDRSIDDTTTATWLGKSRTAFCSAAAFGISFLVIISHDIAIAAYLLICSLICITCSKYNSPQAIRTAITAIVFLLPLAVIVALYA